MQRERLHTASRCQCPSLVHVITNYAHISTLGKQKPVNQPSSKSGGDTTHKSYNNFTIITIYILQS